MIQVNAASPVNWQHPLNRGLKCWYLAGVQGRTGGARWIDLVRSHQGILTNMDPTTDWTGTSRVGGTGALNFDGSNDYVVLPNTLKSGGATALSAAAWMRTSASGTQQSIVGEYSSFEGALNQRSWILVINTAGLVNVVVSPDGTFTNAKSYLSTVAVNDGKWHHVGFRFIANTLELFIDGAKSATTASQERVVNSLHSSTHPLEISRQNFGSGNWNLFTGQLEDVRIWKRAISAAEVKVYYDLSCQGCPGLLNRIEPIIAFVPTAPAAGMLHTNLSGNLQSLFGGMQN